MLIPAGWSLRRRAFFVVLMLVLACTDSTGPGIKTPPPTYTVSVTPGSATISVGFSAQFAAVVLDSNNTPVSGVPVTWTSGNTGIATVTATGVVSGVAAGTTTVTASGGGAAIAATVTVSNVHIASIGMTPTTAAIPVGATIALTATPRDSSGNQLSGRIVLWSSSDPTVATVGPTGVVSGIKPGVVTISAASEGKTGSATVGIAGPAVNLAFVVQPSGVAAGSVIAPAIQVAARDAFGTTAVGFNGTITLAIGTNPGGGTVLGTAGVVAAGGIATFYNVAIDKMGSGYTLLASAPGLSGATSSAFTVSAGAVAGAKSALTATTPIVAGSGASTITVTARDAFGNPVQGATVALTAPGATVTQPAGTTDASGVAKGSLHATKAGPLVVSATANSVAIAQTDTVTVRAAPATALLFAVQPTTTTAGLPVSPALSVAAVDSFGNVDSGFTGNVTLTLGANPGGSTLSGTLSVAAVSGTALFANVMLDKADTGYTLHAAATGLGGATSAAFAVVGGAASQLAFVTQPTAIAAGAAITPAVQVAARDQFGNAATQFNGSITIALGANPGGASLSGSTTVTAVGGIATFGNLSLDKVGSAYTLAASATGLAGSTSAAFDVTAGSANQLAFSGQPTSTTAGQAITPAVTVTVVDKFGNPATSFSGSVTVAIDTNPGGASLTGATTVATINGVATFSGLSLDKAGTGYKLGATATGLVAATSTAFSVTAGSVSATQTSVLASPSTITASTGSSSSTITVTTRDQFGNPIAGATVILAATGTGNAITQPSVTNASGVTTGSLSSSVAEVKSVSATVQGTAITQTASVTVTPGAATKLAFTTQPGSVAAGVAIVPAVHVTALDALGNVATAFSGTVTVAIGANPGGGVLSGTTAPTASAGVATFSDLTINKAGTGYTLTAAAGGLSGATSATFNITTSSVSGGQSSLAVSPTTITASSGGSAATVTVTARDGFGNVISGATVFLSATGTGNTIVQPAGTTDVNGVATGTLSSTVAGSKTVSATIDGSAVTQTGTVAVVAGGVSASQSTVTASSPITAGSGTSTIAVTAKDQFGNAVAGATVVLAATGSGNTLTQPAAATDAGGAASGTLTSSVAESKTVSATIGVTAITQQAIVVVQPGAASQLVFSVPPSSATAGQALSPAVTVTARDAFGNTATGFTGAVTVAIGANPGGGTLSGTAIVSAAGGVASFPTLSIDKAGTGYTLTAAATGLSGATSGGFDITASAPAKLAFLVAPSNTAAGAAITPAVQVEVQDLFGNRVSTATTMVALAIGTNPGGGTLSGTNAVAADSGEAIFSDLSVNRSGTGYTLTASATSLTGTTSAAFNVTPSGPSVLVFSVQPSNVVAGAAITPAVQVSALDALGNVATGFSGSVTVAIGANPGGGTLSGTKTQVATAGVATFAGLSIDRDGAGYSLSAGSSGLPSATSAAFNVTPGPASQLTFTVQPTNVTAGLAIAPAVQVTALDALGNIATGFNGSVTLGIGTNPGGGALSGTPTVAAASGVATFSNLSIDKAGTGYTLLASGLTTGDVSAGFTVSADGLSASQSAISATTPITAGVGTSTIVVTARDQFGNPIAGKSVAIAATGTGNTLVQPSGPTNAAGEASGSLTSSVAEPKVLTAMISDTALTHTDTVDVQVGSASRLVFTVPPSNTTAGAAITPAVVITVQDSLGNTVTSFGGDVTVAIGANPGGGTLAGTKTQTATAGVATFSGLSIDKAGAGYTLAAATPTLAGTSSGGFTIRPGAATQLVFTGQPSDISAGAPIAPAVQLTARDALGNTDTTFAATVTLAFGANPGTGTLLGTSTVSAVAGVASLGNVSVDKVASGYTFTASGGGLSASASTAFAVTAGAASATASTVAAVTDTLGQCLTSCVPGADATSVVVTVRDTYGNPVPGAAVQLSATVPDSVRFNGTPASSASGSSDAAGLFTATFNSAQAQTKILSATANGIGITQTASVAVMPVLVGAGDIADCGRVSDDSTARLLDSIPGTVFANGDNAYPGGTDWDFANCYAPTWGRHKARTIPVLGNHEYDSSTVAQPYFDYFGAAAGSSATDSIGYYSLEIGAWHIVVLNTEFPSNPPGSRQLTWLQNDLTTHTNQCVLALWHRALYTSGPSNGANRSRPLWQALLNAGAEVVLNGHDHLYERFAPQDADSNYDAAGVREFIVGTGGGEQHSTYDAVLAANDEANDRNNFSRGVLRLVLYPHAYRWQFIAAKGFGTYTDSGRTECH